jgi:hypothetical protein
MLHLNFLCISRDICRTYDFYIHLKQHISFQDQHWHMVKFNPSDRAESKCVAEFENCIVLLNENNALNQSLS